MQGIISPTVTPQTGPPLQYKTPVSFLVIFRQPHAQMLEGVIYSYVILIKY
jgi:hypothetical protein